MADRGKVLLLLLLLVITGVLVVEVKAQTVIQTAYQTSFDNIDCTVYHLENAGYICSDAVAKSCNTLAYYISQSGTFASLDTLAKELFGTTASAIVNASGLNSTVISPGTPLLIPLSCDCDLVTWELTTPYISDNISQAVINYTIRPGDLYYKLANETYYGLTTCQGLESSNPGVAVTNLQVSQIVNLPIRCACPFQAQINRGIKMLLTYPVQEGDNIANIVNMFGVPEQDFLSANGLRNNTQHLFPATTVLIPLQVVPTSPPLHGGSAASSPASSPPSSSYTKLGIYVAVAAVVGLLLIALAVFLFCKRRRRKLKKGEQLTSVPTTETGLLSGKQEFASKPVSGVKQQSEDSLANIWNFPNNQKLGVYSLDELKEATEDFDESHRIRGAVFKGVLKEREVAIKRVTRNISQEIEILHKVHHSNLVTLLGFTVAGPDMFYLVYEYAEKGSLSDWLHGSHEEQSSTSQSFSASFSSSASILSWNTRLQIACDVATALQYIHDHINPSFVHKDIKSSNILLDSKFRGRVANFALAKSSDDMTEGAALTKHIVGTQGYLAPEYVQHGLVTSKLDVFAFGVVLLEILSGEEAIIQGDVKGRGGYLAESIGPILDAPDAKEKLRAWIDPSLRKVYPLDCAYHVAVLARACVDVDPNKRPEMREAAYQLAKMLDTSLEWEASGVFEQQPLKGNSIKGR